MVKPRGPVLIVAKNTARDPGAVVHLKSPRVRVELDPLMRDQGA
jgi:hypothetical protein